MIFVLTWSSGACAAADLPGRRIETGFVDSPISPSTVKTKRKPKREKSKKKKNLTTTWDVSLFVFVSLELERTFSEIIIILSWISYTD